MAQTDFYTNNPLIHRDRRLSQSDSEWVRSFSCEDLKPLIAVDQWIVGIKISLCHWFYLQINIR